MGYRLKLSAASPRVLLHSKFLRRVEAHRVVKQGRCQHGATARFGLETVSDNRCFFHIFCDAIEIARARP